MKTKDDDSNTFYHLKFEIEQTDSILMYAIDKLTHSFDFESHFS